MKRKIIVEVREYTKDGKKPVKITQYEIDNVDEYTTVLEALLYIKEQYKAKIAIRYSCRMAICGSCGMMINGLQRLACQTKIVDLKTNRIIVSPLKNYPVIRSLVVDNKDFFIKYRRIHPYLIRKNREEQENPREPYIQNEKDIEEYIQFNYCIQCGLCYSACPISRTNSKFIGPAALATAYRYSSDNRDEGFFERIKIIDTPNGVWGCRSIGECSLVCPKNVDPSLAIQLLKKRILTYRR